MTANDTPRPVTEAGKALLGAPGLRPRWSLQELRTAVLAIEAQAGAEAIQRYLSSPETERELAEALFKHSPFYLGRAIAARRILEALRGDSE